MYTSKKVFKMVNINIFNTENFSTVLNIVNVNIFNTVKKCIHYKCYEFKLFITMSIMKQV